MILQILFIISGVVVFVLLVGKMWQEKTRRQFFLLKLISRGDEKLRAQAVNAAHSYSDFKENSQFFLNKQLPLHTKNIVNKTTAYVEDKFADYTGRVRGSKFLKKNEGISEFFKNVSEREKGEINEEMMDYSENDSQNSENQLK